MSWFRCAARQIWPTSSWLHRNCAHARIAATTVVDPLFVSRWAGQVSYMTEKIPMKRTGELHEIAALVEYIASPEASFTTGFTYDLSGGRATY